MTATTHKPRLSPAQIPQFEASYRRGADLERARILGIMALPEAQDRPGAAIALAGFPEMDAKTAAGVLRSMPASEGTDSQFVEHMAKIRAQGSKPEGTHDEPSEDAALWDAAIKNASN